MSKFKSSFLGYAHISEHVNVNFITLMGAPVKYFKNIELAKLYHVSEKTVRNWIEATQAGKLKLTLHEEKGKSYIANTGANTHLVEQLVKKGKKYKNTRGYKTIRPTDKFYKLFTFKDVADIVSNIDTHREIPHLYSYYDRGAKHWDLYTQKLLNEPTPNPVTKTIELLALNTDFIDNLIDGHKVNVIDLGVGNSLPVKNLLAHLKNKACLNRYIAIDTSNDMLDISERNIRTWFGNSIKFERYLRNIVYDRFEDLLVSDSFDDSSVINLVLFLGATILNFREPDHALQTINNSMSKDDILLFSLKLDTENARRYFDFATGDNGPTLDLKEKTILDLINIEESFYEVEQLFDKDEMSRKIQVRLKIELSIEFQVDGGKRTIDLRKGESILLWRAKHQSTIETINQFDRNGFDLIQATRSKDQEHLLLISKIKSER